MWNFVVNIQVLRLRLEISLRLRSMVKVEG
jgi:hypothetical protein